VETVSREIGSEFLTGSRKRSSTARAAEAEDEANVQGQPLETMARVMFDKASVQQRLSSLERAVDSLGSGLKPEIADLREEISYMRILLEQVAQELGELRGNGKRSALLSSR
jgi:hypothetical protein